MLVCLWGGEGWGCVFKFTRFEPKEENLMEVMPELGVDEVVDQWVDECGGHGQ